MDFMNSAVGRSSITYVTRLDSLYLQLEIKIDKDIQNKVRGETFALKWNLATKDDLEEGKERISEI
mgnify:CR=1 FL=1